MALTFFTAAYSSLDVATEEFLGDKLLSVTAAVQGPLAVAFVIYLILVGFAVLRGLIDEPWREWFAQILKLALIWVAVSNAGYSAWLAKPLSQDAPNAIVESLSNRESENAGTTFDAYFSRSDHVVSRLNEYADTQNPLNPYKLVIFFCGILVWFLTGFSAVIGFAITVFAKIALSIIVALGPIFVALALFSPTRGLFFGFLNQAFNYIILIGTIAAMVGLIISLGDAAQQMFEQSGDPVAGSIIFDIYVLLGTIFFAQAPSIAAGIAGGAAAGVTEFARQILVASSTPMGAAYGYRRLRDRHMERAANRAILRRGGSMSNNS